MAECWVDGVKYSLADGLRLAHTGSVWFKCEVCGKRSRDENDEADGGLCVACWETAGEELEHQDFHFEAPEDGCQFCYPRKEGTV